MFTIIPPSSPNVGNPVYIGDPSNTGKPEVLRWIKEKIEVILKVDCPNDIGDNALKCDSIFRYSSTTLIQGERAPSRQFASLVNKIHQLIRSRNYFLIIVPPESPLHPLMCAASWSLLHNISAKDALDKSLRNFKTTSKAKIIDYSLFLATIEKIRNQPPSPILSREPLHLVHPGLVPMTFFITPEEVSLPSHIGIPSSLTRNGATPSPASSPLKRNRSYSLLKEEESPTLSPTKRARPFRFSPESLQRVNSDEFKPLMRSDSFT